MSIVSSLPAPSAPGRIRKALVGAALAAAIAAPAVAGSVDQAAAYSGPSCGWVSCTVDFNRAETRYIAYGGAAASAYLARIPRIGIALAALGSYLPQWAAYATSHGWCLSAKRLHVSGSVIPWAHRC